jgi:hypothetical protein
MNIILNQSGKLLQTCVCGEPNKDESLEDFFNRVIEKDHPDCTIVKIVEAIPDLEKYDPIGNDIVINQEKEKALINGRLDAKIKEIENGMPRMQRDIALGPNPKSVLNISDSDLVGLKNKAQKTENDIKVLRDQRIK